LLKIDRFTQTGLRAMQNSTATQEERDTDRQTANISKPLRDHLITHHAVTDAWFLKTKLLLLSYSSFRAL
jgi:hypothetical protein